MKFARWGERRDTGNRILHSKDCTCSRRARTLRTTSHHGLDAGKPRVGPNLRASAGFEVFSDLDTNLGFVFGGGTFGGDNFNLSLIAGKPFAVGFGEKELGPFLTVVGLNKKLTRRLRFVSETWFIPDVVDDVGKGEQTYWLSGNVIRFLINNSFALDSGFIFFKGGGGESLPWLDFAYLFWIKPQHSLFLYS